MIAYKQRVMDMDKLTMAHDWYMKHGKDNHMEQSIGLAFDYADAMQAEADKRNNKETCDKNLGLDSSVLKPSNSMELEWQPDWSQAPDNMMYFAVDASGEGWFYNREPHFEDDACWYCGDDSEKINAHDYTGPWQQSLRKRPQGE